MTRLRRWNPRAWLVLATVFGVLADRPTVAAELQTPATGWASWEVAATAGTQDWCCLDHYGKRASSCQLDGPPRGYSQQSQAPVDAVRVYARFEAGQLKRVRMYSASCPVSAKGEIQDLGRIDAARSVAWLQGQISSRPAQRDDLIAALSTHAGDAAQAALLALARSGEPREQRREALFWLGVNRGEAGAAALEPFMRDDTDAKIRQHAAFALAQTESARRIPALIRQGQEDRSDEVRSQAWFWLAQTGAAEAESAIAAALKAEADTGVRHQAIFALSQLPEDRAALALGRVLKDRSLSLEDRKQALFWLGQSDSETAQRYLAEALGD